MDALSGFEKEGNRVSCEEIMYVGFRSQFWDLPGLVVLSSWNPLNVGEGVRKLCTGLSYLSPGRKAEQARVSAAEERPVYSRWDRPGGEFDGIATGYRGGGHTSVRSNTGILIEQVWETWAALGSRGKVRFRAKSKKKRYIDGWGSKRKRGKLEVTQFFWKKSFAFKKGVGTSSFVQTV